MEISFDLFYHFIEIPKDLGSWDSTENGKIYSKKTINMIS